MYFLLFQNVGDCELVLKSYHCVYVARHAPRTSATTQTIIGIFLAHRVCSRVCLSAITAVHEHAKMREVKMNNQEVIIQLMRNNTCRVERFSNAIQNFKATESYLVKVMGQVFVLTSSLFVQAPPHPYPHPSLTPRKFDPKPPHSHWSPASWLGQAHEHALATCFRALYPISTTCEL